MLDQRMKQIPLALNSVKDSVAGQELNINVFPERTLAGKYPFVLRACEGYVMHTNLETVYGVKALYTLKSGDRAFAVTENSVYELYTNGNYQLLGSVTLAGTRIVCADNSLYLVMVDGIKGYCLDLQTSIIQEITDEAFYPACTVTSQDGFFIFERKGTKQFFISKLNSIEFDALDYASANGKPDDIVHVRSVSRLLYLFKESSIEFWYNSGNADFPFGRSQGSFIDHGAIRYTVADVQNVLFYVGSDLQIYSMSGYSPMPIGTEAVLTDLQGINLSDAFGLCYQLEEHSFYVLTIPAKAKTWVYDISMQCWFVRQSSIFGRHVMNNLIRFNSKNLIGDFQSGCVYELTPAAGRDNADQLIKKFVLPSINIGRARLRVDAFQLDMSVGQGKTYGNDQDPQAVLELSKDNGKTWGNQLQTSLGKKGEYSEQVIWRRLGVSRTLTPRITIAADIPHLTIGGAWIALGN